jgi:hypothetical protein
MTCKGSPAIAVVDGLPRGPFARDRAIFAVREETGRSSQKTAGEPKLLDRMAMALRSRHYSRRTGQTHFHWAKQYICFHDIRHPAEMGEAEINAFLTHLALKEKAIASTQNQALGALLFPYRY